MVLSSILVGIIGLFIGSFLNVVNLRFGKWKSIALSRSECPHCKHRLNWFDLIPLLSYLWIKGKCRYCHKKILWQYPVVELASGIIFGLTWWASGGLSWAWAFLVLFALILLLMSIEDFKKMTVPNSLFWAAAIVAIIHSAIIHQSLTTAIYGAIVCVAIFFVLSLISGEKWMGWGDSLAAVPVGLLLGWRLGLVWLYSTFFVGAVIGIILLANGQRGRKDPIPLIPIMLIALLIAIVWGDKLTNWYTQTFFI